MVLPPLREVSGLHLGIGFWDNDAYGDAAPDLCKLSSGELYNTMQLIRGIRYKRYRVIRKRMRKLARRHWRKVRD